MSRRQLLASDGADLADALAAPPGDPLWMLAQQKALGELTGEDAGTPVRARLVLQSIDLGADLEAQVEATPLTGMARMRLALELSRAIRAAVSERAWADIRRRWPLTVPDDVDGDDRDRAILWVQNQVDGWRVLEEGPATAQRAVSRWLDGHYAHKAGLWRTRALRFAGEQGPIEVVDHDGGPLRWTHLRRTGGRSRTSPAQVIWPSPISYRGMPAKRWWTREDERVDLAALSSGEHGLLPSVIARFAVRASDDWFVIPVDAEVGRLWRVRSLAIEDSFGQIEGSTDLNDESQSLWQLEGDADGWRYVPGPTATSGAPEAIVILHRDERTNSGWVQAERIDSLWGGRAVAGPAAPPAVDRPTWRLQPPSDPAVFAWVPRFDEDTNRFVLTRTHKTQEIKGDLLAELSVTDVPEESLRTHPLRLELGWQRVILPDGRDLAWRTWRAIPSDVSSPGWLYDQVQDR